MAFQNGYALVIGVGTHRFVPSLDVPISVADAEAVAAVLRDGGYCGYPADQVKVLSHAEAAAANILAELKALGEQVKPTDTVAFFYEGHGDYGTDGNYYLITHDARVADDKVVKDSGLSQGALLAALRQIQAERVLLIFNACHAGELEPSSFGAGQPAAAEAAAALGAQPLPGTTADALLGSGSGRIILSACREDQRSYIGKGPLSLFTQALVDGLHGRDLAPRGGFISAFDLYTVVYETVKEKALMTLGQEQHPELTVIRGVGPFAVALYRGASHTDLGLAEAPAEPPAEAAVRQTSPEKSQRLFQQFVVQSGGVNMGQNNVITVGGSVIGSLEGEYVDARGSQGTIYKPSGPVEQVFGSRIDTGGGAYIGGSVNTGGGDLAGRDQIKVTREAPTIEQLTALLAELRRTLPASGLDPDSQALIAADLEQAQAETAKPQPNRTLITSRLQGIRALLESAAGAGGAVLALAELARRAVELAGQIFH